MDARLGFTIEIGKPIVFAFAIYDEIRIWAKMKLPISFQEKIEAVKSEHIGINVEYQLNISKRD